MILLELDFLHLLGRVPAFTCFMCCLCVVQYVVMFLLPLLCLLSF